MNKEHLEAIAATIKHNREMCETVEERLTVLDVALNLSATFGEIDSRFDRDKFLTACGF